MTASRVIDFISHFAGHFHINDETSRARTEYDEFDAYQLSVGFKPDGWSDVLKRPDLDEFDTISRLVPFSPGAPGIFGGTIFPDGFRTPPIDGIGSPQGALEQARASLPVATAATGGVSASEPKIIITYSEGGDQNAIQADQHNWLMDNDWTFPKEGTGVEFLQTIDTAATLERMTAQADGEVPENLTISNYDAQSLVAFADDQSVAMKASGPDAGSDVAPGVYLNGVLQADDAELPTQPEASTEETSTDYAAQIATLGENVSVNAAIIVDSNHAVGTLVVVGDYYKTDAIIQVNFHVDNDKIDFAGTGSASIESNGNEAHNIASFLKTDAGVESFDGSQDVFAGVNWQVDVFDGDLYDIQSITQTNWLSDDDVTVQETFQTHQQFIVGANDQGNFAQFLNLTQGYDLVIVLGDYHDINIIYQKNILLDPDIVKVSGQSESAAVGGSSGTSISTGENWLENNALIENFGTNSYLPLTPEWQDLIVELNAQTGELEISAGVGIPNFDDDAFDVLVVTGDMYDINAIGQTNVVADADTAIQVLPDSADQGKPDIVQISTIEPGTATPASAKSGSSVQAVPEEEAENTTQNAQEISAGGNSVTNVAAIVDTGPVADHYIGGEIYEDEILIQTEIIGTEDDQIVYGDPDSLASELVAFTGSGEPNHGQEVSQANIGNNGQADDHGNGHANGLNDDVLGGVLT